MDERQQQTIRQFQRLVERIPGIVAYLDIVQRDDPGCSLPVYISPQIEGLLGYPREAWLTDEELWLHVLHPEDKERCVAADAEARRTLSSLFSEYRMIAHDGRVVWVSEKAAVIEDEETGTLYWQGVMVDITERRQTEDALAASERQFRSMFDAAAIGVMTLGLDGTIVEANATLESICGYAHGALAGHRLRDLLDIDDRASLEFDGITSGQRDRCEYEHRLRRRDGSLTWCRTVMALVRDGAGRPAQVTAMLEDISNRKEAEATLVHKTLHDPLTGLPNRQLFLQRLDWARSERLASRSGVAVIFIDMDGFKAINDTQGHHAGDELLVDVGRRLREAVRPSDDVARYGGDEFLVLAGAVDTVDDATQLAWRLANTLRAPFALAGRIVRVTASLGIAFSSDPTEDPEELVRKADAAMYVAKQRGSNRVAIFGLDAEASTASSAA